MKPRFLLDEHINRAIQRQLRRLDVRIDVLAIGDVGTIEELYLIWVASAGEEYKDRALFIPL